MNLKLYSVFSNCCRDFSPHDKIKTNPKLSHQNRNEFWVFTKSCFFLHTDSLLSALITVETTLKIWKLLQVSSPDTALECVPRPNCPCPNASHLSPHMISMVILVVCLFLHRFLNSYDFSYLNDELKISIKEDM